MGLNESNGTNEMILEEITTEEEFIRFLYEMCTFLKANKPHSCECLLNVIKELENDYSVMALFLMEHYGIFPENLIDKLKEVFEVRSLT